MIDFLNVWKFYQLTDCVKGGVKWVYDEKANVSLTGADSTV